MSFTARHMRASASTGQAGEQRDITLSHGKYRADCVPLDRPWSGTGQACVLPVTGDRGAVPPHQAHAVLTLYTIA